MTIHRQTYLFQLTLLLLAQLCCLSGAFCPRTAAGSFLGTWQRRRLPSATPRFMTAPDASEPGTNAPSTNNGLHASVLPSLPSNKKKFTDSARKTTTTVTVPYDANFRPVFESGLRYKKNDWLTNLQKLPRSYVLHRIWPRLISNVAISIAVTVAHKCISSRFFSIPMLGHNLLGSFLGLLLVFRQNTAYSRFWDARCIWSTAAASCRAMAVSLVTQIRPHAPTSTETLLTLVAAFPDALAFTCLGGSYTLAHNVKKLVIPRAGIQTRLAPATVLCVMLQETIHACAQEFDRREPGSRGQLENLHLLGLSHEVDVLASSLKTCQRILNTPVPWSYSRHTSRFLTIYAATLPLAVVSTLGWLTIPVMTVLSWCLFGIEEIGHLIEQPFVGSGKTTRARMTEPYDIGLPVFILSNQARLEVEAIAAIQPKQHFL